jgi:hypothetical protein
VSGTANVTIGNKGAQSPARFNMGTFSGTPTRVYQRFLLYVDPNWFMSENVAPKFFLFSRQQGNNHALNLFGATPNDRVFQPWLVLQPGAGTYTPPVISFVGTSYNAFGQWVDVEIELIANTPGVSDGVFRCWIDGNLLNNATTVMFYGPNQTANFDAIFSDPTYGGGNGPPEYSMFWRLAACYRESAP